MCVCERERGRERERARESVRKRKVKKGSCIHIHWGKPEYLHFLSSDCSLIVFLGASPQQFVQISAVDEA